MQRKEITKHKTITILFTNQRVVGQLSSQKFRKFSMERKAGLASITGGSLTGGLGSVNPHPLRW